MSNNYIDKIKIINGDSNITADIKANASNVASGDKNLTELLSLNHPMYNAYGNLANILNEYNFKINELTNILNSIVNLEIKKGDQGEPGTSGKAPYFVYTADPTDTSEIFLTLPNINKDVFYMGIIVDEVDLTADDLNKFKTYEKNLFTWVPIARRGIKGEKGDAGTALNIVGTLSSNSLLPSAEEKQTDGKFKYNPGDGYFVGSESELPRDIYVCQYKDGDSNTREWVNQGPLQEGESAYEVYVNNLTEGDAMSEEDWLASLKGKSAFEIYKINNPSSTISEEDWVNKALRGADGKPFVGTHFCRIAGANTLSPIENQFLYDSNIYIKTEENNNIIYTYIDSEGKSIIFKQNNDNKQWSKKEKDSSDFTPITDPNEYPNFQQLYIDIVNSQSITPDENGFLTYTLYQRTDTEGIKDEYDHYTGNMVNIGEEAPVAQFRVPTADSLFKAITLDSENYILKSDIYSNDTNNNTTSYINYAYIIGESNTITGETSITDEETKITNHIYIFGQGFSDTLSKDDSNQMYIGFGNGGKINLQANTITITGNTTLNNTLTVIEETILNNTLTVAGATTLKDNLTLKQDKKITLEYDKDGQETIDLYCTQNTKGGNLALYSSKIFTPTLYTTTIYSGYYDSNEKQWKDQALKIEGGLIVTGATTLNNTLNVTGATTLNNTLTVGGATVLNNTLTVGGATVLNNTLNVTGNTTLNTLSVTDKIILGSDEQTSLELTSQFLNNYISLDISAMNDKYINKTNKGNVSDWKIMGAYGEWKVLNNKSFSYIAYSLEAEGEDTTFYLRGPVPSENIAIDEVGFYKILLSGNTPKKGAVWYPGRTAIGYKFCSNSISLANNCGVVNKDGNVISMEQNHNSCGAILCIYARDDSLASQMEFDNKKYTYSVPSSSDSTLTNLSTVSSPRYIKSIRMKYFPLNNKEGLCYIQFQIATVNSTNIFWITYNGVVNAITNMDVNTIDIQFKDECYNQSGKKSNAQITITRQNKEESSN